MISTRTSLLRRLQAQTLPNATPPIGKILMTVTFEPLMSEQMKKKSVKKLVWPWQFYTLHEQKFSNLRPLLSITFPQGFRISKILDIRLWEVGTKKTAKGYIKSEQTHRQTETQADRHTHTHIWTNRPIKSIDPEGQWFEKVNFPGQSDEASECRVCYKRGLPCLVNNWKSYL